VYTQEELWQSNKRWENCRIAREKRGAMFQCFVSKTVRPGCVVLAITASLWSARAIRAQEPENDELRKVNQSVRALIRKVSPSVVQILVTGFGAVEQAQRGNTGVVIGRQKAIGSGFVIDSNGYIITNGHVVKGADNILVVRRRPVATHRREVFWRRGARLCRRALSVSPGIWIWLC